MVKRYVQSRYSLHLGKFRERKKLLRENESVNNQKMSLEYNSISEGKHQKHRVMNPDWEEYTSRNG